MSRIDQLRAFLADSPADAFLQHALALEHIKIGEDGIAKELFENILTHQPDYVGSYYHLGKLLERQGAAEEAIAVYEKGMTVAKAANDRHAYSELMGAKDDLADD